MQSEQYKDKAGILKSAIKGEEDGYTFYNLLAEKATNPEAKRRLENLRNDEKRHKAVLVNLYKKYVGGEIGELPPKGINALAQVFEKGRLKRLRSEIDYINLAIDAELAATKFYKEGKHLVDDKDFRQIMEQLEDEEHSHYELLMAEREAMSGNYYWFSTEDSAPMED